MKTYTYIEYSKSDKQVFYFDTVNQVTYIADVGWFVDKGFIDIDEWGYAYQYGYSQVHPIERWRGYAYAWENFYENGESEILEKAPEFFKQYPGLII
jgi:hypothetical protein